MLTVLLASSALLGCAATSSSVAPAVQKKGRISLHKAVSAGGRGAGSSAAAAPPVASFHVAQFNASAAASRAAMPCRCEAKNPEWRQCKRSVPKCIFIDLGAADGNSFDVFTKNGYGSLANCPSGGQWEALLIEANPRFMEPLEKVAKSYKEHQVTTYPATAAYMCEGVTSFYLDTVTTANNYWGSSMSTNHPDVVNSGKQNGRKQKVTVTSVNLNRLLYEHTTPGDYVIVKMDIEGAEFDIVPCLATSPSARLMDALWMEQHDPSWGLAGTTVGAMEKAKDALKAVGVYMPRYFSPTLFLAKGQRR